MLQNKSDHLGYDSGPVETPSHPRNVRLLAYWQKQRLPQGPLQRSAFEPLDVPDLLTGIFIAEPVGEDFRFRLAGSDVEGRMQRAVTGKTLMEIFGAEMGPRTIDLYRTVSLGSEPLTLLGHYTGDNLEHIKFEVLHLPLQFDDGRCGILGGQFAFD